MDQQTGSNRDLFEELCRVLPGGVNSPVRAFLGVDDDPLVMERGEGDMIYDVEGKGYLDYCMSFGALLLGHGDPEIVAAGIEQLKRGGPFGTSTLVEAQIAALLSDAFSSIDQLRFVSSGTEAAMTAVRLARAATARPLIVKFDGNYHGHADPFLVKAGSGLSELQGASIEQGLPSSVVSHTLSLSYNDEGKLKKLLRDPYYSPLISAVIVEPVAANMGVVPADRDWLDMVRQETERIGALLIFDEVVSGFRLRFGGVQHDYGVDPDLTCLGKVIGGGMPVAAVGGKREIMELLSPVGEVYQAGTLAGHPLALQTGMMTLKRARQEGFYRELVRKTHLITDPVRAEIEARRLEACVQQVGGMFTIFWGVRKVCSFQDVERIDKRRFKEFFSFLLSRGIYFPPSPYEACFISMAHTDEHLEQTRDAILAFIETC